ncbi:methionine/alanine import family NSS transporter small subunit [Bacillus sp. DX1.1]
MERARCFVMSGSAIMMMIIGIVIIWGGLVLSIANLFRKKKA